MRSNRAERKRAALRAGLESEKPFVAVGAHDAMSAQLIGAYGFDAVWVSGFGVATMAHALPDLNLTTMTETLAAAVRIDGATDLPVLADCDNGFGGLVERRPHGRRVRARRHRRHLHRGQPVPEAEQPLPGAVQARTDPGRGAGAADPRRQGGAGDGHLRASSPASRRSSPVTASRRPASGPTPTPSAGADAILIHSKDKSLGEIEGFLAAGVAWARRRSSRCPRSSPTSPPRSSTPRASR